VGAQGKTATPDAVLPPPTASSRTDADDAFESAEVSGILTANPLHALGLRLLARHCSRLEFVSVDEAREATGEETEG